VPIFHVGRVFLAVQPEQEILRDKRLNASGLTRVATLLSKWQNSSKRCFMRREDGLEVVLSQAETDSHRQFATHRPNFANQKLWSSIHRLLNSRSGLVPSNLASP